MESAPVLRWARTGVAIGLGEALPILVLVAVIALYSAFFAPGQGLSPDAFARRAGRFVGPIAGAITAFGLSWWACRGRTAPTRQAALIGLGIANLDLIILLNAGETISPLVVLSNMGKIVAAILAGLLLARRERAAPTWSRGSANSGVRQRRQRHP
jgi:hypothetical protein